MLSAKRAEECYLPQSLPWFYTQDPCHAAQDALAEPRCVALAADKPKDSEPDKIVKAFSFIKDVDTLVQLLLDNSAGPRYLTLYEQIRGSTASKIFGDLEYELDIDPADFERVRAAAVEVARGGIADLSARITTVFGVTPAFVVLEGTRMLSPTRIKCSFHAIASNMALSAAHDEPDVVPGVMKSLFTTEPFTPVKEGWDTGVYTPNRMLRLPMCVKWGSDVPLRFHRGLTTPPLNTLDDAALIKAAVLTHVEGVSVFDTAVIRAWMPGHAHAPAQASAKAKKRPRQGDAEAPRPAKKKRPDPIFAHYKEDLPGMQAAVLGLIRACGDKKSKVLDCKKTSPSGSLEFYVKNVGERVCCEDPSGQTTHKKNNAFTFVRPLNEDVHIVEFVCSAPGCEGKKKRRTSGAMHEPGLGVLERAAPGSRDFRYVAGRDAVYQARAAALPPHPSARPPCPVPAAESPAGGRVSGDMPGDDGGDDDDDDDGDGAPPHDKHGDDGADHAGGGARAGGHGEAEDSWARLEDAARAAVRDMHHYDSKRIRSYEGTVLPALAALALGCPTRSDAFKGIFVDYHTRTAPTFYIAAPSQTRLWKRALSSAPAAVPDAPDGAPDPVYRRAVAQLQEASLAAVERAAVKYTQGILNPDHIAWAEAKLAELAALHPTRAGGFARLATELPCKSVVFFDAEDREFMKHAQMDEGASPLDALQELYRANASYHAKLDEFKMNRSFSREPAVHVEIDEDAMRLKTPKQMLAKYSDVTYFEKQGPKLVSRFFIEKYVKDPRKNIFERMDMTPGKHSRGNEWKILNTWSGWLGEEHDTMPPEVAEAKSKPWFDHILHVWACGNMVVYNFIVTIFALMVQRPWQRGQVAVVLIGQEGTGKDMPLDILRKHVLGPKHTVFVDRAGPQLLERFGNAAANKVLVHVTEADDMYKYDGRLKALITAETVSYEEKNKDIIMLNNYSTYFFTTNKKNSFNITKDARRYLVLNTDPKYKNDKAYFTRFMAQMNNPEAGAAIFQKLMRVDISDIGQNDTLQFLRPVTSAEQELHERRVPAHALFLSGMATYFFMVAVGDGKYEAMCKDDIFEVESGKLHAAGTACLGTVKPGSHNNFACDVRSVISCFEMMRHGGRRVYILTQSKLAAALASRNLFAERADFAAADQCVVVDSEEEAKRVREDRPASLLLRRLDEGEIKRLRDSKPDHPVFEGRP